MRPHRRQPTRLPSPWDSPGKNTGVGCHFLLQCVKVKSESEVTQSCPTLSNPMDCSLPGSSIRGIFQARVLEWGAIAFSSFLPSFNCCSTFVEKQLSINVKGFSLWNFFSTLLPVIILNCRFDHVFLLLKYLQGLPLIISVSFSVMSDSLQSHGL